MAAVSAVESGQLTLSLTPQSQVHRLRQALTSFQSLLRIRG